MTTRWEYRIEWLREYTETSPAGVATAADQEEQLNAFGLEGWEAFALGGAWSQRVFLKRPLPPTEAEYAIMAEQGLMR